MTRPPPDAPEKEDELAGLLRGRGVVPLLRPLLRVTPVPGSDDRLDRELRELLGGGARSRWIVVTSRRAVPGLVGAIERTGGSGLPERPAIRFAVVGSTTGAALRRAGLPVDLVPDESSGEGLLDALVRAGGTDDGRLDGVRVLLPRAERAREILPNGLAERGAAVRVVPTYRVEGDLDGARRFAEELGAGFFDAATFTSGSAIGAWVETAGEHASWPSGVRVAVLGPVTARSAEDAGVPVHATADEPTLSSLADAVDRMRALR